MADGAGEHGVVATHDIERIVRHRRAGAQEPLAAPVKIGDLHLCCVAAGGVADERQRGIDASMPMPSPRRTARLSLVTAPRRCS
jgi:hypothetical protein